METDIGSVLEARAAALLRGVAKLPPIEQDINRLRNPLPTYVVASNPPWGAMGMNQRPGRSDLPSHNRRLPVGFYPLPPPPPPAAAAMVAPNHLQLTYNANHHLWQQVSGAAQPSKKVCHEMHLPSPSIDSKTPLGVLTSSAAARSRRSSDYSAVSPKTQELTLYSLVENLLKQQHQKEHSLHYRGRTKEQAAFKAKTLCHAAQTKMVSSKTTATPTTTTFPPLQTCDPSSHSSFSSTRLPEKPVLTLIPPPCPASDASESFQGIKAIGLHCGPPTKANTVSVCASRCSTDMGLSRASFWEDDEEEDFIDEHSTFVPRPPQYKNRCMEKVYNLCEESQ